MSGEDTFGGLFQSEESEKFSVLKSFYEEAGIDFKTDLSEDTIKSITLAEFVDKILDKEFGIKLNILELTNSYKRKRVSNKRMGRTEAMKALTGKDEEEEKSIVRKALGV